MDRSNSLRTSRMEPTLLSRHKVTCIEATSVHLWWACGVFLKTEATISAFTFHVNRAIQPQSRSDVSLYKQQPSNPSSTLTPTSTTMTRRALFSGYSMTAQDFKDFVNTLSPPSEKDGGIVDSMRRYRNWRMWLGNEEYERTPEVRCTVLCYFLIRALTFS